VDIETKGCKKAKDSRDEVHDTHSRRQFTGSQKILIHLTRS